MAFYEVTYWLNQAEYGWSEAYISPDVSLANLLTRVEVLLTKRFACAWDVMTSGGVQLAELDTTDDLLRRARRSIYLPAGPQVVPDGGVNRNITIPTAGKLFGTSEARRPDQVRACAQLRAFFDGGRNKIRYFAGVADSVTSTDPGGILLPANTPFVIQWQAWLDHVRTSGWGLIGRSPLTIDPFADVLDVVKQAAAPNLIGLAVSAAAPLIPITSKLQWIGVTQKPKQELTLRGNWRIQSINDTLLPGMRVYFLRGTQSVDPVTIKHMGRVRRVRNFVFDIESLVPLRAGIHKRGNAFPRRVGKRKTIVSLDP